MYLDSRYVGFRPFNWKDLMHYCETKYDMLGEYIQPIFDMSKPEKIVVIGNQLTTDIFMGNSNGAATVWVTDRMEYFKKDQFKEVSKSYSLGQ